MVNSTLGLAGFFDVAAKDFDLEKQNGDFGQTLYVWGFPEGPYLMIPLLGPGNPRDLIGMGVDAYMDPFSYLATTDDVDTMQITRFVVDGIDQRARVIDVLDDLQKNSLDFYAQLRSLSQQRRAAELRHGEAPAPGANFYDDPSKDTAPAPQTAPDKPAAPGTPSVPPAPKVSSKPPPRGMSFTLSATPLSSAQAAALGLRLHYAAGPRQTPSADSPAR
jgi:phospholipid-binding lipoprotein MlaA